MKKISCVFIDWNHAYNLCEDINEKIRGAGFIPDMIIGIARGGWFLARVLCDFLLVKDLFSLKAEHWGITATITGKAEIKYKFDKGVEEKIRGKKVLIADDVTDTGESIRLVVEYIRSLGADDIKTATLHHKTSSSFVPDFYGEEMKEWKWIIYPWSFYEDIADLVEKVLLEEKEADLGRIRECLKEKFDLYVPYRRLKEVLRSMEFHGRIKKRKKGGEGEIEWLFYR
ncbi:MAG: phosphoribosyltransferase [Candidatus Methanospirareceae archaeon]